MKNLKKYLAVLLTLAMMVGLMAACAPEIPAPPAPGTTVETTKAPSSNDNGGGNTPADNPSGNEGQGDTPPATTGETVYDKYEKGTSLRMGVGYNNVNTGIAFDAPGKNSRRSWAWSSRACIRATATPRSSSTGSSR